MTKKIIFTLLIVLAFGALAVVAVMTYPEDAPETTMTGTSGKTTSFVTGTLTEPNPEKSSETEPASLPVTKETKETEEPETTKETKEPEGFFFTESETEELDKMISGFGENVSVMYCDIESGYTYSFDPERLYVAASVLKAPYCAFLMISAENGVVDLEEKIVYTSQYYSGGTGRIRLSEYGSEWTVRQLIEYAIRYSDNVALKMLRTKYGTLGFVNWAASIGIKDTGNILQISNGYVSASSCATYMRAIYDYFEKGSDNALELRDHMKNTTNPMFRSPRGYTILRKYGWSDKSFHDTAIIEAPHPYILIMLTDHEDGTQDDFAMFSTLSRKVENLSSKER